MDKNRDIAVMGIVNLTDDSYLRESRVLAADGSVDRDALRARVATLVREGADIVDLGACSSRPGARPVGPETEWRRLEPALDAIRADFPDLPLSVDTWWAPVVERTFDRIGPFLVNDISAGEDDPAMLPTVGRLGLGYVAMHKRGTPETMQGLARYGDVTREVSSYFTEFAEKAAACGIRDWILDPGFGFAKTLDQNYRLLRDLATFRRHRRKILVGVSRKSMVTRLLGISPEEALPATQVLHLKALENGADILRVHDVAEAVRTVALYRKLNDNTLTN